MVFTLADIIGLTISTIIFSILIGSLFINAFARRIKSLKHKWQKLIIIIILLSPISLMMAVLFLVYWFCWSWITAIKGGISYIKEIL
jgi:hypothetical protein